MLCKFINLEIFVFHDLAQGSNIILLYGKRVYFYELRQTHYHLALIF